MADPVLEKSTALRRYGLVALGFIHIGVGRGLHGTFGVFFVAFLDAFGWTRAVTGAIGAWLGGYLFDVTRSY